MLSTIRPHAKRRALVITLVLGLVMLGAIVLVVPPISQRRAARASLDTPSRSQDNSRDSRRTERLDPPESQGQILSAQSDEQNLTTASIVPKNSDSFSNRGAIEQGRAENEVWWAERAASFFPKYELTLALTSWSSLAQTTGNANRAVFGIGGRPEVGRSLGLNFRGTIAAGNSPNGSLALLAPAGTAKDFSTGSDLTNGANYSPSGVPTNTTDVRLTSATTALVTNNPSTITMESISVANGLSYTINNNANGNNKDSTINLGNSAGFTNFFSGVANDLIYLTGNSNLTFGAGANNNTLTLALASSGNFNIGTGSTLTISSKISENGGSRSITKTGGGLAILSGANTFTGGVTINAGTLRAGSTTALGPAANATLTFGSGSSGKFQLFGFNTTVIDLNSNTLNLGSPVIENGSGTNATLTVNTTGVDVFGGIIQNGSTGTLALTKSGSGFLTLKGANTYTGDTQINAGDLRFDSGGNSNSSTIRLGATSGSSSATLSLGFVPGNNLASPLEARAGTTGTRVLRQLATTGTNTYSGAITMNAGLTLESATGGTLLLQGGSVAFGTNRMTVDSQVDLNGADSVAMQGKVTINELMSSSFATGGSLVKDGSGTLIIQGTSNTYTGNTAAGVAANTNGTQIKGGTLGIFGDGSLGLAPSIATNNIFFAASAASNPTATHILQDTSNNVSLAATRNINVASGITGTFDSNGNIFTVNGVINGSGGNLQKISSGTLKLTGNNTYTGTTTIDGGTLEINNTNSITSGRISGTSSVRVNSGGTLLLSGSSAFTDRINNGAGMTLNANGSSTVAFDTGGLSEHGATNNTAGIGALTLQSSSIIDMGNAASIIAFANSAAQAANWSGTLSIYNWSGIPVTGNGTDQLYFGNNSLGLVATQLADFRFYSGFGTGAYAPGAVILATGEVVPLNAVPEPSTWVAAALALGAVAYTQRRRLISLGPSGDPTSSHLA